ncbi:hypothetical protein RND81_07G024900 [Saponaria officinalis]|uniref:Pectinesterase n=1 Tax=Saponaria officinalis TaxID=3572 RepID=A0AAW1JL62_SAPOF
MKIPFKILVLIFIYELYYFSLSTAVECKSSSDSSKVAYTITVSKTGGANFTTIMAAVNSIPTTNNQWIKIFISPGIYQEQIKIYTKSCIVLEGQDRSTTTITYGAHATTEESITFDVYADNFVAKGITFANSYNRPLTPYVKPIPAVAFRALGDKHAYFSCAFEGYQDTLWDDQGRHYFSSCYIEGAVDFIFGNGQSVYEGCQINVVGGGSITAQSRTSAQNPSGYVFNKCNISGTGLVFIGRAYRAYSRVIFINSYFANVVDPQGWFIWDQTGHENDIIYAEVQCKGPGADTSKRVPWAKKLSDYEVQQYSTKAFIDQEGWISKLP